MKFKIWVRSFLRFDAFTIFTYLTFLIVLFTINYTLGNFYYVSNPNPYGLSNTYIKLTQTTNTEVDYSSIVDYNMESIRIIASTDQEDVIGLFDPSMFYYINATKATQPAILRYFSADDYKNKRDVSVAINLCQVGNFDSLQTTSSLTNTSVINCLQSPYFDDEHNLSLAKNLFSITGKQGTQVYIDSNHKNVLQEIKNKFTEAGFQEDRHNTFVNLNIINSIVYSSDIKYPRFLLITSLGFLMLYMVVCQATIGKNRKKIMISIMSGGSYYKIMYELIGKSWIKSFMLCASSYLIIRSLSWFDYNHTSLLNFMIIFICYQLYISVIYNILYYFSYHKIKKDRGIR